MNEVDRAYIAGLIDGEGSISCGYNKSTYGEPVPIVFIAVGMCNEDVPRWLHELFGGHFYSPKYKSLKVSWKQSWQWSVAGLSCKAVLDTIQPYVRVKVEAVALAQEFMTTMRTNDRSRLRPEELARKRELASKMRALTSGCHDKTRIKEC
jgi:hypothetical protein